MARYLESGSLDWTSKIPAFQPALHSADLDFSRSRDFGNFTYSVVRTSIVVVQALKLLSGRKTQKLRSLRVILAAQFSDVDVFVYNKKRGWSEY